MAVDSLLTSETNCMISSENIELLQFRINEEEKSSRIYENMSLWLSSTGFLGASALWSKYSKEELEHASWSKDYLLNLGIQPECRSIPSPTKSYEGFVAIVELSMQHEILVTKQCSELAKKALESSDFLLFTLASRYTKEQVEELGKMQNWLDRIKSFGSDKIALRLLDEEMSKYL